MGGTGLRIAATGTRTGLPASSHWPFCLLLLGCSNPRAHCLRPQLAVVSLYPAPPQNALFLPRHRAASALVSTGWLKNGSAHLWVTAVTRRSSAANGVSGVPGWRWSIVSQRLGGVCATAAGSCWESDTVHLLQQCARCVPASPRGQRAPNGTGHGLRGLRTGAGGHSAPGPGLSEGSGPHGQPEPTPSASTALINDLRCWRIGGGERGGRWLPRSY